jgi:hypothetical protein
MTNTFKRLLQKDVGLTSTQVGGYTVPTSKSAITVGFSLCNTTSSEIIIEVLIKSIANDYYIIKNQSIPANETLVIAGGDQKIVFQETDEVYVKSNTATSLDVVLSIMEMS